MWKPARLGLSLVVAACWLLVPAPAAFAAISSSFSGGVLTVTGGAGADALLISCSGSVVHNDGAPLPGSIACSSVTKMVLIGGAGNDSLNVFQVSQSAFSALTLIDMRGEGGGDSLQLGVFKEKIDGGTGSDRINQDLDVAGLTTITDTAITTAGQAQSVLSVESISMGATVAGTIVNASSFSGTLSFNGSNGVDTVTGTSQPDQIQVNDGSDVVNAGGGNDTIFDALGNDTLRGGNGSDILFYSLVAANVTLTDASMIGSGTDTLSSIESVGISQTGATGRTMNFSGFSGSVSWQGGAGNDVVTASTGGTRFTPGGGNDTFNGGVGIDSVAVFGTAGATLTDSSLVSTVGNAALNSIDASLMQGTSAANTFNFAGFSGATRTESGGGGDTMIGGSGPDTFSIFESGDTAVGNGGLDTLDFFANSDITLTDTATTGDANMTFSSIERAHFEWDGALTLDATAFTGPLTAEPDGTGAIRIESGSGNDVLTLSSKGDVALGGAGNDKIFGLAGNDNLNGGAGNDLCKGGTGNDHLTSCEQGKA